MSKAGIENGIVVDIGGTSSDAGYLQGGFPKEASTKVKVGGVNTNFQMPDVICKGLGGGSRIRYKEEKGQIVSYLFLVIANNTEIIVNKY